jgi:hypothetical protein
MNCLLQYKLITTPDHCAARLTRRCCAACRNRVDLNRDFPDPVELNSSAEKMQQPLPGAQPETIAMMKWTLETPYVILEKPSWLPAVRCALS